MDLFKKLFTYVPEKKGLAILSVVFSVVSAVILMMPYWYLWQFLLSVVVENDFSQAKKSGIMMVALLISYLVIYVVAVMISHLLAFRLESNLRKTGTRHLLNASFSFFDTNSSGRIRKIIDDNAAQTHMVVAHLIPDLTSAVVVPVLMFVLMFLVDWKLGVLLVIATCFSGGLVKLMYGEKQFMEIYQRTLERMNSEAVEYVRGIQVLKIFKTSIDSYKSFYIAIKEYSEKAYSYSKSCRTGYVTFQVILNVFITFTIPFAILFINRGMNPSYILAEVIFFACFEGILFVSFMKIMYVGMYQFQAKNAVEKLENLFSDMEKKKLLYGNETKFQNFNIEFKDVSFKYEEKFILKNLNFLLEEGKTYALVGSSGGGKSTIAKLISGFYSLDGGKILVGGKEISEYTEEAVSKNIAFVFQNSKLFKTSIFENVKIARPSATREEVLEALRLAQCNDILEKFSERENTIIGSKGVHLSGGEIQRIAVARVILKDAGIVILDEASAAADPENEYELQQAFSNMMKGKTVVMIAHRLSSIKNVDEILLVEDGAIVERGKHAALMEAGGKYKKLQELYSNANDWRI